MTSQRNRYKIIGIQKTGLAGSLAQFGSNYENHFRRKEKQTCQTDVGLYKNNFDKKPVTLFFLQNQMRS